MRYWRSMMSRRILKRFLLASFVLGALAGLTASANDGVNSTNPTGLVAQALEAEAKGELVQRERFLAQASSIAKNLPEVNWFSGKVRASNGKWLSIDESVDAASEHNLLNAYEKMRASKPDTIEGHLQLATWCATRTLTEQCEAHLNAIIKADPDHVGARNALGYRMVDNEWVAPEKLDELGRQAQVTQQSLTKYGAKIGQVFAISGKVEQLKRSLNEITSADAIPAMESIASNLIDRRTIAALVWINKFEEVESSQSLCRFALLHPSSDVRDEATKYLREKPIYDYMPELLNALSGPIQASLVPAFDRRGNMVGYRQAFTKEGMNENKIMLVDRSLTNGGRMEFRSRDPINVILQTMARGELVFDARSRDSQVASENIDIQARNRRIVSLISDVSDEEFPNVPTDVWKWWDQYNETNYQAYKPSRYRRESLNFEVPQYSPASMGMAVSGRASGECFVAGTSISTQRGFKPVEQISIGDMALSRNTVTGELCWKPVIARTTRPAEPTVVLGLDDGDLRCTGGHLLWVSGKGWTKASQIKQGDLLHTANEPALVMTVRQAAEAPTFNLEVAENHSYFAGTNRVLSHDVTARGSSRDTVPGQLRLSGR
ncbi:MAG: polymorphic toxin-type HINT domain-containing protein [Pirellulales bacterium]